jgi:hypothetical protein
VQRRVRIKIFIAHGRPPKMKLEYWSIGVLNNFETSMTKLSV